MMPRWNNFTGTLVFGAVAAVVSPAVWLLAGPLLGVQAALALYWIACAAVYLAGLATTWRRGLAFALPAATLAGVAWIVSPTLAGGGTLLAAALISALLVSLGRATLFAARSARGVSIEVGLVVGGLWLASWLATPGPMGAAVAIWGFFLVQSGFFLVGPPRESQESGTEPDPFERARARMLALLDE